MLRSDLLRVREDDPEYRRQAAAEAEFWSRVHPCGLEALEEVYDEGPSDRYINERFTGDQNTRWYDLIPRYGTFRRGLVLGTSAIGVERLILGTNPALHVTFADISPGALARRDEKLGRAFPGRVATRCADLNFVEFVPDTYDLVVSSGTIHHVTNLEYLADRINQALTPEGYFFFQDYVGEPRFGCSPAKKRLFEVLHDRARAQQGVRRSDLVWADAGDLSPFCGVRSDETLAVLRHHLVEVRLRTAGCLFVPLMRARPADGADRRPETVRSRLRRLLRNWTHGRSPSSRIPTPFLRELGLVGDAAADAGLLAPGTAFGIYRKRS